MATFIFENMLFITDFCSLSNDAYYRQWRIYYEANEASASGPHHLGGPHKILTQFQNWTFI